MEAHFTLKSHLTLHRRTEALYQENATLRQQLGASRSPQESANEQTSQDGNQSLAHERPESGLLLSAPFMGSDDPDPANVLRRPSATEAESNFTTTWDLSFAKPTAHPSSNTTATSSRSLAGITVEATEIDEIFRLYDVLLSNSKPFHAEHHQVLYALFPTSARPRPQYLTKWLL